MTDSAIPNSSRSPLVHHRSDDPRLGDELVGSVTLASGRRRDDIPSHIATGSIAHRLACPEQDVRVALGPVDSRDDLVAHGNHESGGLDDHHGPIACHDAEVSRGEWILRSSGTEPNHS